MEEDPVISNDDKLWIVGEAQDWAQLDPTQAEDGPNQAAETCSPPPYSTPRPACRRDSTASKDCFHKPAVRSGQLWKDKSWKIGTRKQRTVARLAVKR